MTTTQERDVLGPPADEDDDAPMSTTPAATARKEVTTTTASTASASIFGDIPLWTPEGESEDESEEEEVYAPQTRVTTLEDLDAPQFRRLGPEFWTLVQRCGVAGSLPSGAGRDKIVAFNSLLTSGYPKTTLAEVAKILDLGPVHARGYVRNLFPALEGLGVFFRERRLREDFALTNQARKFIGEFVAPDAIGRAKGKANAKGEALSKFRKSLQGAENSTEDVDMLEGLEREYQAAKKAHRDLVAAGKQLFPERHGLRIVVNVEQFPVELLAELMQGD